MISRAGGRANPIRSSIAAPKRPIGKVRQFEPSFALRAARHFLAPRLPKTAIVAELGCGTPALVSLLPKGVKYIAVDVATRADGYRTARLDQHRFPRVPQATHLLIFGWLELLTPDLPKLLRILRRYDRPVIATYHATDDSKDIDRAAHGWVNHYDRKALAAACRKAGFKLAAAWARDGRQSFLHLRPLTRGPLKRARPD